MTKARRRVRTRRVLLLLALGLVINIGVALGISQWGLPPTMRKWNRLWPWSTAGEHCWEWKTDVPERWPGPVPSQWLPTIAEERAKWEHWPRDKDARSSWQSASVVWAPGWARLFIDVGSDTGNVLYLSNRIGFPLGALRFDRQITLTSFIEGTVEVHEPHRLYGGWPVDARASDIQSETCDFRYTIPLVPVWSGLIVNTLIYAGVLWLIAFLIGLERARHRRVHGLCEACGYDITGVAVCPECGKASR